MDDEINEIVALLFHTHGTDISIYEEDFLKKTIEKRLFATSCATFGMYLAYLKKNRIETDKLLDSLHIGFSEFFRNPLTFSVLEQIIVPLMVDKKSAGKGNEIRVWSAACASGQEAYSLAMLLEEIIESLKSKCTYRIFATDISQLELDYAQKGIYHKTSLNKMSLNRFQRYFTQLGDHYAISPSIQANVDFSIFDLLTFHGDSPPASIYGNFDFIFCSNVLFYYKPEFRTRILTKLSNSLATGGFLITGETERDILSANGYREAYMKSGIFKKSNYNQKSSIDRIR